MAAVCPLWGESDAVVAPASPGQSSVDDTSQLQVEPNRDVLRGGLTSMLPLSPKYTLRDNGETIGG